MQSGPRRLFAGSGISGPGAIATILVVLAAFAIGIGAGWGTTLFADSFDEPTPSPSPSHTPSPSATPAVDVSLPPFEPVTREIDDADRDAGLRTLDYPVRADGTFYIVPAANAPAPSSDDEVVRFVRIDVEDGLQMIDGTLAAFVMSSLNDSQGWGAEAGTTFVQTEGAPDVRIVFASPFTAVALCPTPHEPAPLTPTTTASPSPTPSPTATTPTFQCAAQDTVVVSVYDWIQGLPAYGEERGLARDYFLNHGVGHVAGKPDESCKKGVADVMVNQRKLAAKCQPNPWPFPAKD